MTRVELTAQDTYVLARALVGLPYDGVPLSPITGLLLAHLDPKQPEDVHILRRVLGQQLMLDILRVDPEGTPPETPFRSADLNIVPELPENARLTMDQVNEASHIGRWLDDYLHWAGSAANETPLNFHLGAGLYLAAIAVGRRLYIQTPWRQQVFPNLYIMIVAVSTYYRKSAGLSLAAEVARLAIPHMMMPQPGSPENFMSMLGGVLPPNFSDIPQQDRARLEKANSNTNNKGLVVIRDAALSILGAATPAELATALSSADWFNGNLARFSLLTPETDYRERKAVTESLTSTDLANRLKRLHERLPEPPLADVLGEKKSSEAWSLVADI